MEIESEEDEFKSGNYEFKFDAIEDIWYIFFCLSDTTFSSIELSVGEKGNYVISCETMMSVLKTIETIDFCCYRGAYSDAYTLIRKYRDDLMQYLFLLYVIQNKHGMTDEEAEKFSLEPESLLRMIEMNIAILVSGNRKTDAEFAMEKWVYNELDNAENVKDRKDYFDASKYKMYLAGNNEKVKYLFDNFLADKWKQEDRKLNNYVHTNGIKYLTANYVFQVDKKKRENELIETLQSITDIFLSLLAVVDSTKLHSSDYFEALEMGMKPIEESQYWVCPIIVEYMNDRFDKKLLSYIQEMEGHGMQILSEYYSS